MSYFKRVQTASTHLFLFLISAVSLLLLSGYSYGEDASSFVAVPPLINATASGDKPNIMIVLDNSNSMDEAPSGQAVGSANAGSKSEIARNAVKNIINSFGDRSRLGLMAYRQSGVSSRRLHDAQYDASFDPSNYDPNFTGDRASKTKKYRVINPTDPNNYIYYNVALPLYSTSNLQTTFCYSSSADFDNGSENAGTGPWDTYKCYRTKTGISDNPNSGFSGYWLNTQFTPTDSDYAQNILDFGTYLNWQYVGRTWYSNTSPGQGYLHVAIDDVDATHKSALLNKLGTSQFTTTTDTPLRNAGLTPIAGTLESASKYFGGTLPSSNAASGVDRAMPPANLCGVQNFVVMVTDGLPSVDKNGNTITDTAAAIQASADEAAVLLSQGIRTYVVGFALPSGVDGTLLDKIAEAGGTKKTLLANDSVTLNNALGGIFLDIFNRTSSSSAAAVLANNARGEGAVFQALYSPSVQDSSGAEVTWTGSLFGLFIDELGLLREDTNGNAKLDGYNVDRTANYIYDAVENKTKVELFTTADATTPPDIENDTPVATVALNDIKPLWQARDQLSAISDPVTQRSYNTSAANGRYILTSIDGINTLDFKPLPSGDLVALTNAEQQAKTALDTARADFSVAQAQYNGAENSVADQQIIVANAEGTLVVRENNVVARTDDLAQASANTGTAKTAYENTLSGYSANELGFYNDSLDATNDFFSNVAAYNAQKTQSDASFDTYVGVLLAEGGQPTDTDVQAAKTAYEAALSALELRISSGVVDGLNTYQSKESDFYSESADTIGDCIQTDLYRGTACESLYEAEKLGVENALTNVNIHADQVMLKRNDVKVARDAYVNALLSSGADAAKLTVQDARNDYIGKMSSSDARAASTFDFYNAGSAAAEFKAESDKFRGLVQGVVGTYLDYQVRQDSEAAAQNALNNAVAERAQAVADIASEKQVLDLNKIDRDTASSTLSNRAATLAAAEATYREAFNSTFLNYLDTSSGTTANNVVRFIRGEEGISGFRNRTIDYNGDGTSEVWRLGDIVNSTPALVASPDSGYDVQYGDDTYAEFREKYKNRRNVVYVGGNDGMLHAFNAGFWNGSDRSFQTTNSFTGASGTAVAHPLGSELWAYIPKPALPHLQWLTNPSYAHTYYVDGQPLTFDAKIFPDDATHPGGWGTVLVVGMGLGGGTTQVDSDADGVDDQTLRSSYILLDITDPEQPPALLAEITHPDLAFTTGTPALFKQRVRGTSFSSPTQDNWYLVFGSGPTDITKVTSDQPARIYVYDLEAKSFKSGYPRVMAGYPNSFVGDVGVVDWDDNYLDDTAYFGITSGDPASSSSGAVGRLRLSSNGTGTISTLLTTGRPVGAKPHLTKDGQGRHWVYFGTGRLLSAADNVTKAQNRFYGLYEPVDSSGNETSAEVSLASLFDITDVVVKDTGAVSKGGSAVAMPDSTSVDTFNKLKYELPRQRQGWYRNLENDGTHPTERNVSRADSIRSVLFYTTYKPSTNQCTPEGTSRLFGVDFQTGVAPPFNVFSPQSSSLAPTDQVVPSSILLGQGLASAPTIVSNRSGGRLQNSDDSIVTIVTQSSTGQLQLTEAKVGATTSSRQSWREITK
ncbi:transcriptional regulator [Marinobacter sp. 1-3A]|uniref:transcriptional regulator n=1 Tax=Marinobacter sp. 1-3A TaxID=2582920 RepID=UPI0019072304|nr:transcriptional regulator [Marinobacter sp. 1-3A]MBK1874666.1 transcriptional regulator [Marinobacter sp. 1-3A]